MCCFVSEMPEKVDDSDVNVPVVSDGPSQVIQRKPSELDESSGSSGVTPSDSWTMSEDVSSSQLESSGKTSESEENVGNLGIHDKTE